jgi:tryptophan synthase alpha subunit
MTRIAQTFARLRGEHTPGLVTYVTAGDPDLDRTAGILHALDRAGADVLEVGVPFSDPLADGPVIQRATERALAAGTTLSGVLDLLRSMRRDLAAPVVIFSYANPILRLGPEQFADRAVSDLPVALGFGISKPDHVREVARWADAAVVGSALVDVIAREGTSRDLTTRVEEYVRWLKS